MSVFIGGAWPYANGSLHIGHIAALLPGDILARYHRQNGQEVLYVSGSDCNGTPISIRASQEGRAVKDIADQYHQEFNETFTKLGFTYDLYTRTDDSKHHQYVQELFLKLLDNGYLYKKTIEQAYCAFDNQFLPDRFVEGICPVCGARARGDQCDTCSTILDRLDLLEKQCKICGNSPEIRETDHFYFAFSQFQKELEELVKTSERLGGWRDNALKLTTRYLSEGVHDRAVTRDLPNGVPVPVEGFEGKKIYVWIEAVAGYYTASRKCAEDRGVSHDKWWEAGVKSYYVHGKDNIPFHSIIWPAILSGAKIDARPTAIVSNEYMTLEKRKISTSQNWAVWVPDVLERYHPDSLRYFLTVNAPENRDTDFSWREFVYSHNSELLGAYGNLINRTFKFIEKSYEGKVPNNEVDSTVKERITFLYKELGRLIEAAELKRSLEMLFEFIREMNRYFDEQKPWISVKEDEEKAKETLTTCVYAIQNLAQLAKPFIPFGSQSVERMTGDIYDGWKPIDSLPVELVGIEPLYERIDVKAISQEVEKLNK
ncbi:methionine--tRNA ligase [Chryseomicrobium sp. FSL W7-1435]|uniref:methionine--tRNA ligase n=1 Tax=Chryseomicrobium sp. FSL W7-1435 TaxID=2921704 RepID=UPI003159FEBC